MSDRTPTTLDKAWEALALGLVSNAPCVPDVDERVIIRQYRPRIENEARIAFVERLLQEVALLTALEEPTA